MADEKYRLENHTAADLDELLTKLGELYSKDELDELLTSKVDKAEGMGLSQESFTTAEKSALALINAAFPFVVQRGEYTLNDQSELTFDTLADTKYYRYTASAIGNPVQGGYGIIINIRYTAYAVQILFSQTTATAPTQMLYRIGTNMSTAPTWKEWQTAGGSESFAIKKLTYTGDGNLTNQITFPALPKMILKITGRGSQAPILETVNIIYNQDTEYYTRYLDSSSSSTWKAEHGSIVYSGNTMTLTTTSSAASGALNTSNQEYTVFYV